MRTFAPVSLLLILLAGASARLRPLTYSTPSTCALPADAKWEGLLDGLRFMATSSAPEIARYLKAVDIPAYSLDQIAVVTADSLCDKAGRLMNQVRRLPDTTGHTVRMVRIGRVYWAEDNYHVGEWIQALVIDSAMTTVLSLPGR